MRGIFLRTLVATITLCTFAVVRSVSAQSVTKEAKETGAITGRVMSADERPVAGAGIILLHSGMNRYARKPEARAVSGADGYYRLAPVAAGSYQLQLLAPGYTPANASSQGGRNEGRIITIAAGETIEHQDFQLARGGVITGRVADTDGKPIIAEPVRLLRANRDPRTDPGYVNSSAHFETDDRGVYRMYGVPAGRYLVFVGEEKERVVMSAAFGGRSRARTFYPNATEEAQAKIVEVASVGEATGVDITLAPPLKIYAATGRMLDAETGQPVANLSYGFGMLNADGKSLGNRSWSMAKTNAAGEFRFDNLSPGRYAAFAVAREGDSPNYYSGAVPFEIEDDNVSGIVVRVQRGAVLSGVASIEGTTNRAVLAKLAQAVLNLQVVPADLKPDEIQMWSSSRTTVQPDGSFRLPGLPPGKAQLVLDPFGSPQGLTLLRIERGGVEQRGGIEIGAGQQVSDVRVRLAYGTSIVRGQVEVRRDGQVVQLPEGGGLYLTKRRVGTEESGWGNDSVAVDARGRFLIEGLAAGEYELSVSGWTRSPTTTFPLSASPSRQIVNVPETGETNVTLVYDLSAKPQGPKPTP
jgi:protocatechuate 3,4-dioxygenase beta subunit